MAKFCSLWFYILTVLFIVTSITRTECAATEEERKVHIVYMGSLLEGKYSTSSQHGFILQNILENSSVSDSLVRSYKRSFNGFAAKLTSREREKLAGMEGVVSVFPSTPLQLQTTRSWDFMGLSQTVTRSLTTESDVIVGVFDTGIWPESDSFSDKGFSPAPKKWKGVCKGGKNFTCNNKIVGARYYTEGEPIDKTARDIIGHGSHTASTAAGNNVKDASFYGIAQGTARGGVPSARISVYKVCSKTQCEQDALLAAFDDAISDGVDIITLSIGPDSGADELTQDTIAIGAFHAMEKGILTVNSAGNGGSDPSTVTGTAPWVFTVAASNTDRQIIDKVVLANGISLPGISINSFLMNHTQFPLAYGKAVSRKCDETDARNCVEGCLEGDLVKGKIIICDGFLNSERMVQVAKAGGVGTILRDDNLSIYEIVPSPASYLNAENFTKLLDYFNTTKIPQATILKSEAVNNSNAPLVVAEFSSRGPNPIVPEILKPDISAPGINILAAFSPIASPSHTLLDKRSVKYSILTGTSMACPHVAGASAYVKSFHPNWSPSAIKSALMTTAWSMNAPDKEFAYGSGHISPVKAVNPGLVYETSKDDYIQMLCSMGYNETSVRLISGDNSTCQGGLKASPKDLNYPSMTVKVNVSKDFNVKFPRTVTNVGEANSTYKAQVTSALGINITIVPDTLSFKSINEKKSFIVSVVGKKLRSKVSSSLVWSDGTHSVRSPIIVYTKKDSNLQ